MSRNLGCSISKISYQDSIPPWERDRSVIRPTKTNAEDRKHLEEKLTKHNRLEVFFDGACEPINPGGTASCGWHINLSNKEIACGSHYICSGSGATNNLAEYYGLGYSLRWCVDNISTLERSCVKEIYIFGDSKLVINQITGRWKCYASHLKKALNRCKELKKHLTSKGFKVRFFWIPRESNKRADFLSKDY